jgi:hypothetical protein
MYVWEVRNNNKVVICTTVRDDREQAKRQAAQWLGVLADNATTRPIATPETQIKFDLTLQV